MSSTEEQQPSSGSVPHAFRNALFWRWTREMPSGARALPSGFVTLLYALASAADTSGRLRFRDGTIIKIKDIAAAIRADEKDARRYLKAAVAAGVVAIEGEQKRGRPNRYALIVNPRPDWDAAAAVLRETKRVRKERKAAPWREEKNGGRSPELSDAENGGPPPELTDGTAEEERGTAPRSSSGDRPPSSSGDRPPYIPGEPMELPHGVAEEVFQPQVDGRSGQPDEPHDTPQPDTEARASPDPAPLDFARCTACGDRMVPRPGRTTHTHCQPADHRRAS